MKEREEKFWLDSYAHEKWSEKLNSSQGVLRLIPGHDGSDLSMNKSDMLD
jgi:hypothetical protein